LFSQIDQFVNSECPTVG